MDAPAVSGAPTLVVGLGEALWDLLPGGPQLGGAPANFAYHAAALGAHAVVASAVGDDALGRDLVARLRAAAERLGGGDGGAGLDVAYLAVDAAHPTGTVTVALDAAGKPRYTIHEGVAWDFIPASDALLALAPRTRAVCFGSLAQRMPVSRATIQRFLGATPPDCLRVFDINLRQHYYGEEVLRASLERASALKINDEELPVLAEILDMPPRAERADAWERATVRGLCERYGLAAAALTRGARGCLVRVGGDEAEAPGLAPARIADTVGAGDAFTAAFVMGLLAGRSAAAIAGHANRLASYVCSQSGAMPEQPAALRQP